MPKTKKRSSFSKRLLRWLMLILLITISGISYLAFQIVTDSIIAIEHSRCLNMLDYTNEHVNVNLNGIEVAARNYVKSIEKNIENLDKVKNTLSQMMEETPTITGVGLAFTEDYHPKKGRWHEIYFYRGNATVIIKDIGSEDHDYLTAEWFLNGLKTKEGYWSNAYVDNEGAGDILTSFAIPVHDAAGNVIAVMATDVSLKQLQNDLQEADERSYTNTWLSGALSQKRSVKDMSRFAPFSFILQRDGTYLVHPDSKRLLDANFYKEAEATKDSIDDLLVREIKRKSGESYDLKGSEGDFCSINIDGSRVYVVYGPIKRAGWTTIVATPALGIEINGYLVGGAIVFVMIIGMIAILIVCHLVVRKNTKPLKKLAAFAGEVAQGNFHTQLPTIKHNDEFGLLRDSFENMQQSLEHYVDELKKTTASKAAYESELRIANSIQMAMLPKVYPPYPERKDIDIYGELTPAKAVGGDLYDFYLSDNKLFFCIGDVSGKGIPASLVMAVSRSLFRNISSYESSPGKIVSALNNAICENNSSCMFVTIFVGVLDLKSGDIKYCNAGHEAPLLIGRGIGHLPCLSNFPIGVVPGYEFQEQEEIIDRDTTIFMYTDGLNEAEDDTHAQFGVKRITELADSLLQRKQHQPECLIHAMTDAVHQFVGDAEQSDDLTMLAIQLKNAE